MDHAVTLERLYSAINDHDLDAFGGFLAEGFVEHEITPGLQPTKDGAKDFFRMQLSAFPDLAITVEDMIDGGDKLVARVRLTGTHHGEMMGMPATGNSVDIQIIDIMRFADDGLVHEHWGVADQMAMMTQLGAVPA